MLQYLFSQTPLRFFVEDLWRDEAFSYLLAKLPVSDILRITAQDFNPPLYYILLHYWMSLFGTSEVALRGLSFLFYGLGLFAVFETMKIIYKLSFRQSFLYLGLFILNPLVMFYAFEARMYSMLFCLAMYSCYFFLREKKGAYAIVTILGLYTHYFMMLVIGAQALYLLLRHESKRQTLIDYIKKLTIPMLCGLSFIPWMIFFLMQNASLSGDFWISKLTFEQLFYLPVYIYTGILKDFWVPLKENQATQELLRNVAIFIYVCLLFGFFQFRQTKKEHNLFLFFLLQVAAPISTIVLVDIAKPLFLPRYLIAVGASISLLIFLVLSRLNTALRTVLIAIFLFLNVQLQMTQMEYRSRGHLKETIQTIQQNASEEDVIYVTSELNFMVAQYYFDERKVYIYGKTYEEIPNYVGKVLIPAERVTQKFPPYPQKAFIIQDDLSYEVRSDFY